MTRQAIVDAARKLFGEQGCVATRVDDITAESLALATQRYRAGPAIPARRLDDLGRLRAGSSVAHAVDVLWFYFGYASNRTLVGDNGWTDDQAERWLYEQARGALVV